MTAARRRFNAVLHTLADRDYLLAKIAYEAAPTITGIKPASLVTFCRHERNICDLWGKHQSEADTVWGCRHCELKKTASYTLVLFYNRGLLGPLITAADNQEFLKDLGYEAGITLEQLLPALATKLASEAFPHELGLLLGIPRDDVAAFIANRGADCLFCGYWKVYNNPARARSLFRQYDAAKRLVMDGICQRNGPVVAGSAS